MRIFFSVGETSGDIHGANLIRDLKAIDSDIDCVGLGGAKMEAAGCELQKELVSMAVMGIVRAVKKIPMFRKLLREVDAYFANNQVDAVVLIDFPGFNWHVARKAKERGIPVFYYGVPQMWGWAPWRVRKLRKLVDFALCKLPFEEKWFCDRDCQATYVGHPFFDEVARQKLDQQFLDDQQQDPKPMVLLLPGSRDQEVMTHAEILLNSAQAIHDHNPNVRFACACVKPKHVEHVQALVANSSLNVDVYLNRTPELIRAAHSCLACSGSVSLELMASKKPTVIVYQIGRVSWGLQSLLRRSKYITLVNLLSADDIQRDRWATYDPTSKNAVDVPFPEFLCVREPSQAMGSIISRWLNDPAEYQRRCEWLAELFKKYGTTGASENVAKFIHQQTAKRLGIENSEASPNRRVA